MLCWPNGSGACKCDGESSTVIRSTRASAPSQLRIAVVQGYHAAPGVATFFLLCAGPHAQFSDVRQTSPMNSASMPVLRNVAIAWAGVHTMGSLSLNEVLRTIGTPVRSKKREISS